ncbi:DJ-1/PfpI family protein [Streptomyces sp. S1D4-11]|nr:DJ-1/PfpI family protein [Streptomyces sp. S1D4-11]QIZ00752.1 DJ-1/PfpI family protein [Streptomyces sp. S1D4-11]
MAHVTSHAAPERHLQIGSLLFEGTDQIFLTGPFEVFSRIPNATYLIYGLSDAPVHDSAGLRLAPDLSIDEAPQLDVLHVPGGVGQQQLMDDQRLLGWLRRQGEGAGCVFSVCTGALLLGAAGMLIGRRATTHWAAFDLLPYFGAEPVDERVVTDGNLVCAAGVTAGIDGALTVAARLRGAEVAQEIQLHMEYAPEPPFDSGTLRSAPPAVAASAKRATAETTRRRRQTAIQVAARLGITPDNLSR